MIFRETPLPGAYLITAERVEDERGFFARTWCEREFTGRGLDSGLSQCSTSFNRLRGTLRGMHYQAAPHAEAKLVRCTRGRLHDVIIDLRPDGPTYLRHHAVTLSADEPAMLYVPAGCAHGFLTLADATEVLYQVSVPHVPAAARGIRWNDPTFAVAWPERPRVMSARDREFADFRSASRAGVTPRPPAP